VSTRTATIEEPARTRPRHGFAGVKDPTREDLLAAPIRWSRPSRLESPVSTLSGVGPRLREAATDAGIDTLADVLWRVPHSYRDRSEVKALADLRIGEEATVLVEVGSVRLRRPRRRGLTILEVAVTDGTESVKAVWFNQPWLADRLAAGTQLLLVGALDRRGFRVSEHEIVPGAAGPVTDFGATTPCATGIARGRSPKIGATRGQGGPGIRQPPPGLHTTGLVPVHPATEKLRPQRIRDWVWQALAYADDAIEPLPAELRARRGLAGIADALRAVHFPESEEDAEDARKRLAFEELFLYQAALATRRRRRRSSGGTPLGGPGEIVDRWIASLPFELTADQKSALAEVDADLDSDEPMQRLLMGEVGSGKTVVALYAMLRALEAGHQAALMAPTETLAEQHATTLDRLLAGEAIQFALLTGATKAARRRETLARLASGELKLVVGTHALIEPTVEFASLAVCIVDEQHRFGVRQRRALDARGEAGRAPHVLHMTATPIPRTLSLTAYGDLDTTTLRELPAGRPQVKTWQVEEERRDAAYEFIRGRLREGRQAYVVCPLVLESEKLQARAAREEAERLASGEFRDFTVDVIDGQMPSAAKQQAMEGFASGRTDVLVATTVIEVGIDVANATVMLIEGAERYGVSQLHQLRGRVGRGDHESFCILFADQAGELARRRLDAVAAQRDGFALAEVDLSLRGEGEILGTRQSGLPRFSVATLPEDTGTLIAAREEVIAIVREHGSLGAAELGPLADSFRLRFGLDGGEPIPA
jgi:ATP-dependent DNA helicase RecG